MGDIAGFCDFLPFGRLYSRTWHHEHELSQKIEIKKMIVHDVGNVKWWESILVVKAQGVLWNVPAPPAYFDKHYKQDSGTKRREAPYLSE